MDAPFRDIPGDRASGLLMLADHASNAVPPDVDLGIDPAWLELHIALDIGVAALAERVCARLGCHGVLGQVSRLVVDLHRERDHEAVIPHASDGRRIGLNHDIDPPAREARLARFWDPYHAHIDQVIEALRPTMLFTLHSFTPALATAPDAHRPWQVGLLYNRDERAPRIALPMLEALGLSVGDNEPYSGKLLNATMNRHAEARGLPYLAIEVRNDLIGDEAGARKWAGILARVIAETRDALA
ncbi:MAG: N-formylglutamate amidohydrolase [Sphingomonadaceae bacterium]|nr:N-formylglutamate amidohydrolase [Sphingomonadaceae bacterium]